MKKFITWTLCVLGAQAGMAIGQTTPGPDSRSAESRPAGTQISDTPAPPPLPSPLPVIPSVTQPGPASTEPAVPVPPALPTTLPATVLPTTQPTEVTDQVNSPTTQPATRLATIESAVPAGPEGSAGKLHDVLVTADLDRQRAQIAPSLGAVTYSIGPNQIQNIPGGENAPFQQVLLRAPGVVEDSFGQVHVRGEHANLTYRVNGVLLPVGIASLGGFGQELDTHIINSLTLIDGSLPAQFGFRTAGIVDVATKSGATLNHNEFSLYGGSYNTLQPSLLMGGTKGNLDYFVSASFKQSGLGIENPTSNPEAQHDWTNQAKAFGYFSWQVDDTSRVSLLLNGSYGDFQIPTVAGQPAAFTLSGAPNPNSANVNETQNEQDYYSVISYQKTVDKFSFLVAGFSRYGQIHFKPDPVNDLVFSGVGSAITNSFLTNGVQFDGSYKLNQEHTIRFGLLADYTSEILNTDTSVFPVDSTGAQTSTVPFSIIDKGGNWGNEAGVYLQDEWKLADPLTLNYGVRYDRFDASFDHEDQVSPRANLVFKIDRATTAHAGYARYFAPPPVQFVGPGTVARFANTSNAPENFRDDRLRAERSNYYDIGIGRDITPAWHVNLDAFYKAAKPLLDSGQFGNAIILSPFNYREGKDYGAEFSTTYKQGGLSLFANFAWVSTTGRDIDSSQFLIANDELAFISKNFIHLDHESEYTVSAGIAYAWKDNRVFADILYGSGLRAGFANTLKQPDYYPVNAGFEHIFRPDIRGLQDVRLRFDIVNVFDQVYQLRNGTGIGVGAPQFGQRRGFFAGLTFDF